MGSERRGGVPVSSSLNLQSAMLNTGIDVELSGV